MSTTSKKKKEKYVVKLHLLQEIKWKCFKLGNLRGKKLVEKKRKAKAKIYEKNNNSVRALPLKETVID